jgi:hypothetical protein
MSLLVLILTLYIINFSKKVRVFQEEREKNFLLSNTVSQNCLSNSWFREQFEVIQKKVY